MVGSFFRLSALISIWTCLAAFGGLPFLKADHALRWGFELSQTTSPPSRLWRPL
jgi:predicted PurR-regulated permease PerM